MYQLPVITGNDRRLYITLDIVIMESVILPLALLYVARRQFLIRFVSLIKYQLHAYVKSENISDFSILSICLECRFLYTFVLLLILAVVNSRELFVNYFFVPVI